MPPIEIIIVWNNIPLTWVKFCLCVSFKVYGRNKTILEPTITTDIPPPVPKKSKNSFNFKNENNTNRMSYLYHIISITAAVITDTLIGLT